MRRSLSTTARVRVFEAAGGICNDILRQRLEDKAMPEPMSGCWLWIGACSAKGYGHMWTGNRYEKAHRLSYLVFRGEIPSGHLVCHRCDNPYCVNPDHLWLGTQKENITDCIRKGRLRPGTRFGDDNRSAKLSQSDVDYIRCAPNGYGSGRALAKQFGVTEKHISLIRSRKLWRGA